MCRRAPRSSLQLSLLLLGLGGCLEYGPHVLPDDAAHTDLNRKAAERLLARPPPDALRFAVVGDTQRSFDEAAEVVERLNARDDLQFVVQMGDFTQFGLWLEYREMHEIFRRLRVPYFVIVGIHDLLANGGDTYARMFGPPNFAFTYGRVRLVLFDSNSRALAFDGTVPDVAWIEAQLAPGPHHDRAVALSHVAPNSPDFDPALAEAYHALLVRTGTDLSLHAHAHKFDVLTRGAQRYVLVDSVDHRSYLVVTESPGGFTLEKVDF